MGKRIFTEHKKILSISKNGAVFKRIDESECSAPSLTFTGATVSDYSDLFGLGKRVDLVYTNENPKLKATHTYYLYSGQNYLLTELKVEAPDVDGIELYVAFDDDLSQRLFFPPRAERTLL